MVDHSGRFSVIGYRLQGDHGWRVTETDLPIDEARSALSRDGYPIVDVREIYAYVGKKRPQTEETYDSRWGYSNDLPCWGWTYDEDAQCWRAPGENILPPPGNPRHVSSFRIEYATPDVGWLPVTILADDQHLTLRASNSYDPFGDLIEWLERITDGEFPRTFLDVEGSVYEFFTFETPDPARIRFLVAVSGNLAEDVSRNSLLDVTVKRRALVHAFYGSLREYAESDSYDPEEWAEITLGDYVREAIPGIAVDDLAQSKAEDLTKLFWVVYPKYQAEFTATKNERDKIKRFAEWVKGGRKEFPDDMVTTPKYNFVVPGEFDGWGMENKLELIEKFLAEQANSWTGCNLRELRSEKLEKWLQRKRWWHFDKG